MNPDATRVTGPGTGGEKHAVSVTRMCLRSGTVQLPFALAGRLPAGELAAFDAEADAALGLWSDPPRHVAGLSAFFEQHELQVNDQITFELRGEDLRIGVVKRPRRSRPKVTPSSWDSLRDGPARSRTFEPTAPDPRSDEGSEAAMAREATRPVTPGTEPPRAGTDRADERTTGQHARAGTEPSHDPVPEAEPDSRTDPGSDLGSDLGSDHGSDHGSDPFAELHEDHASTPGLGGFLGRARDWFGGGRRHGSAHDEADPADTFRRRTVEPEPDRSSIEAPDDRAPTVRDEAAADPGPPQEAPRAPSPIRVRRAEPEPPETDRRLDATADDVDPPDGDDRHGGDHHGGDPEVAPRRRPGPTSEPEPEPSEPDGPPPARARASSNRPAPERPAPERPPSDRPAPERPSSERPPSERPPSDRPSRARPTAPWRVREARLRAASESSSSSDSGSRSDSDRVDADRDGSEPEAGKATGRGNEKAAPEAPTGAAPRATSGPTSGPTSEATDRSAHDPDRTEQPERPAPERRFSARGSSDPERIRLGSDRSERGSDVAGATEPDPLRRRPSRRSAEARSPWPDDLAHDRFDGFGASDDDFLEPLGGPTPDDRPETGDAESVPTPRPDAGPTGTDPQVDRSESTAEPVVPRVPGVRSVSSAAAEGGDLRTRLARFLASPEMSLIAKVDVIARRFDLDDEVARELLSDIADDPPSGLRLTPVREGAWRIERTGI